MIYNRNIISLIGFLQTSLFNKVVLSGQLRNIQTHEQESQHEENVWSVTTEDK